MIAAQGLSAEDVGLIRASFDEIWPVSDRTVDLFYRRLFEIEPGLVPLFRGDMTEQKRKFISTLAAIVASLDDRLALSSITGTLGRHHVGYGVAHGHYAIVGEALLWTLAQTLDASWSERTAACWRRAYDLVAADMQEAAAGRTVL